MCIYIYIYVYIYIYRYIKKAHDARDDRDGLGALLERAVTFIPVPMPKDNL